MEKNNSFPVSMSVFLLDGSKTSSLEIMSNNVTNEKNGCEPIIVELDWNMNDKYDPNLYVPQCVFHKSPPWNDEDHEYASSVNTECIPVDHNDRTVHCACHSFGRYSTATTHAFAVSMKQLFNAQMDPFSISVVVIYLFCLCVLLENKCSCCYNDEINDDPLVSLEVYLSKFGAFIMFVPFVPFLIFIRRQRHRMWVITREGRTHFLLRYKFEKSQNKNWLKLFYIFKHFMFNDGLILPYFKRHRGSNHYPIERIVNLFWFLLSVLVVTAVITASNNDINPEYCLDGRVGYVGSDSFCMRADEIPIAFVLVLILCAMHFVHRLVFQRIHPNKLQMDLNALLSVFLLSMLMISDHQTLTGHYWN